MRFRFSIHLKDAEIIIKIAPITAVSIHIYIKDKEKQLSGMYL
jgi:hypothetical protein